MPALFFGLSYGLAMVIKLRLKAKKLPPMALGLDFGQIVNLLLLTLPVLTAVETYFGMEYEDYLAPGFTDFTQSSSIMLST
jgi:hypothetical protein